MTEKELIFKDIKLAIPVVGYINAVDTPFQERVTSCGMCCVVAVLKTKNPDLSLDQMISKGIAEGGFSQLNGWGHDYFVNLLKDSGFIGAHREQNMSYSAGIQKIGASIKDGNAVIISGRKLFMEQISFHMVLIVGTRFDFDGNVVGFYYHDPATKNTNKDGFLYVSVDNFKQFWRQMAIFCA